MTVITNDIHELMAVAFDNGVRPTLDEEDFMSVLIVGGIKVHFNSDGTYAGLTVGDEKVAQRTFTKEEAKGFIIERINDWKRRMRAKGIKID